MSSRSKRRGAGMATAFYPKPAGACHPGAPAVTATRRRSLPEAARELGDDPVAQHVGHLEDAAMDRVVVADIGVEAPVEAVDGLLERLVEMRPHHRPHLAARP